MNSKALSIYIYHELRAAEGSISITAGKDQRRKNGRWRIRIAQDFLTQSSAQNRGALTYVYIRRERRKLTNKTET